MAEFVDHNLSIYLKRGFICPIMSGSNTYFISDFHLGVDSKYTSREREKRIVNWITTVQDDMAALYLVGDIFDYWFEYGTAVPKGFTRILGKLAELRDKEIPVYFFTGNHDMWMFRYLEDEMGIPIYREPQEIVIHGKKILVGHGDGLGPGDKGYKFIKKIFSNSLCQWAYARIHPNLGLRIMKNFSKTSRENNTEANKFLGPEKEWLVSFCEEKLEVTYYDYFIFGHRHLPISFTLTNKKSRYINLGDWLSYETYFMINESEAVLKSINEEKPIVTDWL